MNATEILIITLMVLYCIYIIYGNKDTWYPIIKNYVKDKDKDKK